MLIVQILHIKLTWRLETENFKDRKWNAYWILDLAKQEENIIDGFCKQQIKRYNSKSAPFQISTHMNGQEVHFWNHYLSRCWRPGIRHELHKFWYLIVRKTTDEADFNPFLRGNGIWPLHLCRWRNWLRPRHPFLRDDWVQPLHLFWGLPLTNFLLLFLGWSNLTSLMEP